MGGGQEEANENAWCKVGGGERQRRDMRIEQRNLILLSLLYSTNRDNIYDKERMKYIYELGKEDVMTNF